MLGVCPRRPSRSPPPPPVSPEEFEALCAAQTQVNIDRANLTTSQTLQEAQIVLDGQRARLSRKQERELHYRAQAQAQRVTGEGLGSAYLARLFQSQTQSARNKPVRRGTRGGAKNRSSTSIAQAKYRP